MIEEFFIILYSLQFIRSFHSINSIISTNFINIVYCYSLNYLINFVNPSILFEGIHHSLLDR